MVGGPSCSILTYDHILLWCYRYSLERSYVGTNSTFGLAPQCQIGESILLRLLCWAVIDSYHYWSD
jgi:hypothetical protein